MPKLIKCFPEWYDNIGTGGIFKDIATGRTETFPWLANAATLDMEYFGNKSGNKSVSPIIEKFIEQNIDAEVQNPFILTTAQRTAIANIIVNRYSEKWQKLYALLSKEYDPIENYLMTEIETPNITKRQGVSSDYEVSDERTIERNLSRSESASDDYEVSDEKTIERNMLRMETASNDYEVSDEKKTETNYSVSTDNETNTEAYGFNSASPVPTNDASGNSTVTTSGNADENTETNTHKQTGGMTVMESGNADENVETNTHRQTGGMTVTESGRADENIETNTHKQTGYKEEMETGTRQLTRSGNIGVTTSQQMIESEIALWQWNFIESVYKDVDMVLTIPKYKL